MVIVVDGLDHVWRAKDSRDELTKLFDQLLPAPPGIVLVVGTQPVQDKQLPASLIKYAPRDSWIVLPPLDKPAIKEWLDYHHNLMPSTWFAATKNGTSFNWLRACTNAPGDIPF